MSRTKLRILFLDFKYEVLCKMQAESEAVMGLINKEKVLRGVGKAVDAANNAADKVHDYAKEKNWIKKRKKRFTKQRILSGKMKLIKRLSMPEKHWKTV